MSKSVKKFSVAQLDELESVPCPCGETRRAFTDLVDAPASMHLVTINSDSRMHYHKTMSEIYLILDGEGHMEVDDDVIPLRPMTADTDSSWLSSSSGWKTKTCECARASF